MKVLVTGATGFVGAHSAAAVERAGHDVRLLVRDPDKASRVAEAAGFRADDVVAGDITDAASVEKALAGCDAVVHAAAAVSIKRRDAAHVNATNLAGAEHVLRTAADQGLQRIVHVSSTSALDQTAGKPLTVDTPIADAEGYAGSKAAAETVARDLQENGAPLHITYPGGVIGPAAGESLGESSTGIARFLSTGLLPTPAGAASLVDVRDVAEIHVRLLDPGDRPARIMCGGTRVDMRELGEHLHDLTGRRFPMLPTPPALLRAVGRVVDRIASVVPLDFPLTEEAMTLLTTWPGTEDNAGAVGVVYRPVRETLRDSLQAWLDAGLITRRQAGAFASNSNR